MKTKITKRMASSITTTTSNPINKKYLEYCEDIKASFKQCTYYMKRKKKTCTRRVNDFNTQFCSLHTPEGLARERKKGEETRKVYNKLVDKTCEEYLKELVRMVLKHNSNVNNSNNSVTNDKQLLLETYYQYKKQFNNNNNNNHTKNNNNRSKRVSAPNRMVNPLSAFYNVPFDSTTNWDHIFPIEKRPIHIDVGCARGEFVFRLAEEDKFNNYYFIGCEIRKDLVIAANKKKVKRKMSNLHFIPGNFSNLIVDLHDSLKKYHLEIKSISIQFPDPWRRKKFQKRLIVQNKFIDTLAKELKPKTLVYFSSDVEQIFEHMYSEFSSNKYFHIKNTNDTSYQFHKIPTERTLVCEQTFRKIWHSVAIRSELEYV